MVDIKMPDDFLLKIWKISEKSDEIVPKMLELQAAVVISKVKSNLQSAVGKGTKYESKHIIQYTHVLSNFACKCEVIINEQIR